LCVVGMYAGRVVRVNSWDVLTAPSAVAATFWRVPQPMTVVELAVMFFGVGVGVFMTIAVAQKARARVVGYFG